MADFSLQGMFNWAVEWCNRPNVEYYMSPSRRNMREIDGVTFFDCSSFVFFAVWLGGGYDIGQLGYPTDLEEYKTKEGADGYNAWTTGTMPYKLPKIGFVRLNPVETLWQPGDILVVHDSKTGEGHTEICYKTPRVTMGAHNSSRESDDQVSINTWNTAADYYKDLWRYTGEEQEPPIEPPYDGPGGDAGVSVRSSKSKFWMYMKPYWKI